jgi:tetratricopeptide (TPR) repeat protein
MGQIHEGLGELDAADAEYRLAETAYAEQVRADPENGMCCGNQALALMALGRVNLHRQGHGHEASGFFSKASDVLAAVEEGEGEGRLSPRQVRALRADALHWQGVLLMDTNPRKGREFYQRCVELREEVVALMRIEAVRNGGAMSVGLLAAGQGLGPVLVLTASLALQRGVDDAQRELARRYLYLGGADLKLRNVDSTGALYSKSLQVSRALAAAYPDDPVSQGTLAAGHERLGDFYLRSKRPKEAGKEYAAAAAIYQSLARRDPSQVARKDDLSRLLYSVATAALLRGDRALAARKYHESLEIRAARTRELATAPGYLDYLATLARCGDYRQAAEQARRAREASGKNMGSLIDVACCFAICSERAAGNKTTEEPSAEEKRLRDEYAGQALEALQTAVRLGYRNVYNLETEPDLDGVRQRPELAALLAEVKHTAAK